MFSYVVPPAGIEPTLQAPQACVLSVERRGQKMPAAFFVYSQYLKIPKTPAGDGRVIPQDVLRAGVRRECRLFPRPLPREAE